MTPVAVHHSALFDNFFASGTVEPSIIDELGGCQLEGVSGIGVEWEWVRVAYVEFTADQICEPAKFQLSPAHAESAGFPPPRGLVPTWDINYGTCTVSIRQACRCIYVAEEEDNCTISGGDLGYFAGCWECADDDPSPPCWSDEGCSYYDYDGNGAVHGGDLAWLSVAWNRDCAELDPLVDFPEPCDGEIVCPWPESSGGKSAGSSAAGATVVTEEPVMLTLRLGRRPSRHRQARRIDAGAPTTFKAGAHVFAEVWARDGATASDGLTAVFTDVFYEPSQFEVVSINPGDPFTLFTEPRVDATEGVVRGVGGATMEAGYGAKRWTRVSVVELRALRDVARPRVMLRPSEGEAISRRGKGLVSNNLVRIISHEPSASGLSEPTYKRRPGRSR